MFGMMIIEAGSLEEAIKIADELPLPDDAEYATDSFEIDVEALGAYNNAIETILEEIKEMYG
jgi:hypothetical protein